MKDDLERLKAMAQVATQPVVVASQKATQEAEDLLRELEIPQPVVCPGCFEVLLCHPYKYAIIKVKISYFYACKNCKLPVVALPQFLEAI